MFPPRAAFAFLISFAFATTSVVAKKKKKSTDPVYSTTQVDLISIRTWYSLGEGTLDDFFDFNIGLGVDGQPNLVGMKIISGDYLMKPEDVVIEDGVVTDVNLDNAVGTGKNVCTIAGVTYIEPTIIGAVIQTLMCDTYICFGEEDCLYAKGSINNANVGTGFLPNTNNILPQLNGIVLGGTGSLSKISGGQMIYQETIAPTDGNSPGYGSEYFAADVTFILKASETPQIFPSEIQPLWIV